MHIWVNKRDDVMDPTCYTFRRHDGTESLLRLPSRGNTPRQLLIGRVYVDEEGISLGRKL